MKTAATPKEIEDLAKKVDKLGESLSNKEKTLLLGVFGMAQSYIASNVERSATSSKAKNYAANPKIADLQIEAASTGDLPKLSDGLIDAFKPGLPSALTGVSGANLENDVGVGVGAPCVDVSWSKDTA
jgi:hypothetical protein